MKRCFSALCIFLLILTLMVGCSQKALMLQDVMFVKTFEVSEKSKEDYDHRSNGKIYLGLDKKKVDSVFGVGYELEEKGGYLPVFYGNGITVLFSDEKVAIIDYVIDDTSMPAKRNLLFSIFKDVNLYDKLDDVTSKLGEDYYIVETNDVGTPTKLVYVYEFNEDTYLRQRIPNNATMHAQQLSEFNESKNTIVIVLYLDQLNRYQEIYRFQIGNLKDILEYRTD